MKELFDQLADKYPGLTVYRGADGKWCVYSGSKRIADNMVFSHADLETALRNLRDFVRLPYVPAKPTVNDYEVKKQGKGWTLVSRGQHGDFYKTRKRALEVVEIARERETLAVEEWELKYGPLIATGVEGVDYTRSEPGRYCVNSR